MQMLLRVQSLDWPGFNQDGYKAMLFPRVTEFKSIYGYFHKGMIELLKWYGADV